ncbi:family 3 carbohydrate esterase, partial [Bombardia bombarda]
MKPLFIPSIGALLGAAQLAATAAVYGWHSEVSANNTHPFAEFANHNAAVLRRQSKVPLRILTLGASIANGVGSSTGNGFRKPIRDALRFDGWEVNMVGSKQAGTMVDWDNEGTPSAIITDLYEYFPNSAGFKANVVLINLGTNDANGNIDVAHAGDRMEVLLSQIWDSPDMAKTCIILSTLIPSKKDAGKKNNPIINRQYRQLVSDLQSSKCIYLADMDPESGPAAGWLYNDISDVDFIHPNDLGHSKMAYIFWKALTRAANDGKIVSPAIIDLTGVQSGCDKKAGDGKYAGALTQQGWGIDDGIYYHDSEGMGTVLEINSAWDRNQWRFARLYGPKHDDFVGWFEKSTTEHAFGVWKNLGNGKFEKIADLNPDLFCNPAGVNFIDMNADGYDDLVCIDGNGNAYLSINQKDGTDTKPPTFKRVSDTALIKTNEGYPQDKVRMTDIDGDGRGDYCIIDGGGNIRCWRNGWVDDIPKYWQDLGQRFEAKGKGDYRGVRFVDMNGDGRDDWIWVSDIGAVETWTNARSCAEGKLGDGLNVAWRQGFHKGESDGDTHYGLPEDAKNDTALRDRIMFGRVYGEPEDLGLLGKMDYVYLQHEKIADDNHKFSMRVWKNTGFGGTKLKADGNKYCNMVGHEDGREDFVWTLSTGKMRLFPNKGLKQLTTGQSFWGASAIIWDPVQLINKELNRRDIHLMDWDGDGICDIVWLNPDNQNRPSVWINHYDTTKNWDAAATWEYYADPPSARAADVHCAETRGLDLHDLPVRFGDIDGNKRDDFLCIRPDGHVTAYVHNDDNSWKSIGQVKFEDGMDRANLRWADVNGDGKDDMIWINKFNGEGTAFYNRGYADPAKNKGSVIHWDKTPKAVYVTVHRAGTCIYFPDLDGNGRADLHAIGGTFTNTAETWFNPSCGLTDREGDDAGCCADPKLPVQPGSTD